MTNPKAVLMLACLAATAMPTAFPTGDPFGGDLGIDFGSCGVPKEKEWKPKFSDEELEFIRSRPTRKERKRAMAELRAKHLAIERGKCG